MMTDRGPGRLSDEWLPDKAGDDDTPHWGPEGFERSRRSAPCMQSEFFLTHSDRYTPRSFSPFMDSRALRRGASRWHCGLRAAALLAILGVGLLLLTERHGPRSLKARAWAVGRMLVCTACVKCCAGSGGVTGLAAVVQLLFLPSLPLLRRPRLCPSRPRRQGVWRDNSGLARIWTSTQSPLLHLPNSGLRVRGVRDPVRTASQLPRWRRCAGSRPTRRRPLATFQIPHPRPPTFMQASARIRCLGFLELEFRVRI